jgi:hypothetical protein
LFILGKFPRIGEESAIIVAPMKGIFFLLVLVGAFSLPDVEYIVQVPFSKETLGPISDKLHSLEIFSFEPNVKE